MAAGEDQLEPLIGDAAGGLERLDPRERVVVGVERHEPALAPQPVDRAVARGGRDPRRGVGRDTVARPAL
jgi:hypothetical protein